MSKTTRSKAVWIINHYGSLPNTGMGGRPRHLSSELAKSGHKVILISARWSHNTRDTLAAYAAPELEEFEGFHFLRIPVIRYRAAHDKKRILNWLYFSLKLLGVGRKLNEKPDVIIYSSPSLIGFLSAYRLSKRYKAKLVFEVRDIWPLTLIKLGGYSSKHPFIMLLQFIEDFAYKKSDYVISNLQGISEHMETRGILNKKFSWIPNGISPNELDALELAHEEVLASIKAQPFSISYVGALGLANSLDTLIDAAKVIKKHQNIHINIVGRGPLVESLKSRVANLGLSNVHFWGPVPKSQVQSILRVSDASIICWKNAYLYKYGVAANKIFDYLYAGKPIINAYSGQYDLVSRYQCGITVPAESPLSLAKGICELAIMDEAERIKMGASGYHAVTKNHDYRIITEKLNQIICEDLGT